MKKIGVASLLLAIMFVLSSFAVFADYDLNAYPFDESRTEAKVSAKANNSTPTIDGNISAGEGWGDAVTFNHTNMPTFWNPSSRCIIDADVSFAWDADGMYVAAEITDPHMIAATGEDTIDAEGAENDYGWDGDVFIFAIDPAKTLFESGMVATGERSAWYCISVTEANELLCYASSIGNNSGDITGSVEGAAKLTSGGWAFEIMIPWSLIDEHTMVASGGSASVDERVTTPGNKSNVGIMYMDRAVADGVVDIFQNGELEEGQVFTVGRSICVPMVHDDGMPWSTGGESIRSYGVELSVADASGVVPVIDEATDTEPTDETTDPEETSEAADDPEETDKATEADETEPEEIYEEEDTTAAPLDTALTVNNNNKDDGGISIVLIIVIIVAVVAVAGVVVFILMKKKKGAAK